MANYLTEKRSSDFYRRSTRPWRLPMATPIRSAAQRETATRVFDKGVEKVIRSLVHLRDTYPREKRLRELVFSAQSASNALRRAQETRSADRSGSRRHSSNATLEEVRNALGRARRPSHSILPSSRAKSEPGPCSHIPTRRRLDSRQCRADKLRNDPAKYETGTPFLLVYRSCALQFLEPVEHEVELGWLPHVPMAHHEKTLAVAVDVIVRAVPSG